MDSESLPASLVSDGSLGACIVDREGKIILLNKQFSALFSLGAEECKGLALRELLDSPSGERLADIFSKIRGKKTFSPAFGMKAKGGQVGLSLLVREISAPLGKAGESSFGILASDATSEVRLEEEAAKISGAIRENLKEIAHLGTWEYDVVQDKFTFNDAFYAIFKTTAEEVGGYDMSSQEYARRFVHPDDAPMVGQEVRRAIETDDPFLCRQVEHRIIYRNGSVGYITVRFFIVKDGKGRTVRTYGVNQDITEYKRAQEELRMANEFMVARSVKVAELERENAELKKRLGD